jgi:hemerythrin
MTDIGAGLTLGIPEIDDQHVEMLGIINEISEEVRRLPNHGKEMSPPTPGSVHGDHCEKIKTLLIHLVDFTAQHFQSEEDLMVESGYPELAEHKYEHKMLIAELKVFVRAICNGEECLGSGDLAALRRWLIGHIVLDDRLLAKYILAQDITSYQKIPDVGRVACY